MAKGVRGPDCEEVGRSDSGSFLGSRWRPAEERLDRGPDGCEGLTLHNAQLPPRGLRWLGVGGQ